MSSVPKLNIDNIIRETPVIVSPKLNPSSDIVAPGSPRIEILRRESLKEPLDIAITRRHSTPLRKSPNKLMRSISNCDVYISKKIEMDSEEKPKYDKESDLNE